MTSIDKKRALYSDYFTLPYAVKLNISPFLAEQSLPDENAFFDEMPYPFKLAAQLADIDQQALRPLSHIGGQAEQLVDYLRHQSKKIDLIMSYILSTEDDDELRFHSDEFGAGGLKVTLPYELAIGQSVRLKLFLSEMACAVYCYAEVIAVDSNSSQPDFITQLVYTMLREDDREILVKAALHEQSKQLRKLAEQRAVK